MGTLLAAAVARTRLLENCTLYKQLSASTYHGMWMHLKPQERCQNPGTCSCAVKTRRNLKKKQKEDGRKEPERQKKDMNQTYGKSAGDTN